MAWFFKSKSAAHGEKRVTIATLQEDLTRLQSEIAEANRLTSEWQTSAEAAINERDALRLESEQTISNERQLHADKVSELTLKHDVTESDLKIEQQKLALLDEANMKFAEMVRERDHSLEDARKSLELTIKEASKSLDHEIQTRDAQIRERDERIRHQNAQHAEAAEKGVARIDDLSQQLANLNEQSSFRIQELEQKLVAATNDSNAKVADAESRIAVFAANVSELERKLTESETRSANRADQRSALLRNMAEINRLSTVSGKTESSAEALKILNPGWSVEENRNESESA